MGLSAKLENTFVGISKWTRARLVTYTEYRNINKKQGLIKSVILSDKEKQEIDLFFLENYGKKMPYHWHKLYQSYTGTFHKDYFPEILFSTKLEPILNPYREAEFLGDKNLLPLLFEGDKEVVIPETFGACVKGRFLDYAHRFVSVEKLCEDLSEKGSCVVKKTIETSSGRDVQICDFHDGKDMKTGAAVKDVLSAFGNNFIVQEKITQHESLSRLNDTSVNTFRIITYYCNNEVHVCPVALRLGRSNADRDNIHYGGICVGVDKDGNLKPKAFSEYGDTFNEHPDTHIKFDNYVVGGGCFRSVVELVKERHGRMPHLGILSWDITLDEHAKPIIIEINTTGQSAWFCQMVNGEPLFGENTADMLKLIKSR